ncbi:MAG TPA: alpha/beta fold hydrolase, partial [Pyrinomonadaceae bacterium]|nr:alpha/beta fold hydrolase [Pyrinomonadaceae bacterium]
LWPAGSIAQTVGEEHLEGYWAGAFIRDGAVQPVNAEVRREGALLRIELEVPERAFAAPMVGTIERDASGRLKFDTFYGPAIVALDPVFLEMVGEVAENMPPLRLHLKRALRPHKPKIRTEEVTFRSGDTVLSGTLVLPEGDGPHPAALEVHGRGCQGRAGYLRRLAVLARYGVAGLAFDKRGVGASKGRCESATIEDETRDVLAALDFLAGRPEIDRAQIGAISTSAGGWVVPRAAARSKVALAFIVTTVGPATSVREQQLDNARYISRDLKLSAEDQKPLMRYIELMFTEGDAERQFAEMRQLIAQGEKTGWAQEFLDETDVAPSAAEIKNLWVRRFNYDPREDLKRIKAPFLALYGGSDRVVPPDENVPELRRLLTEAGNRNFRIVVIPEAGHGLDQGPRLQKLPGGKGNMETYYWKFGRISPTSLQELVDFLQTNLKIKGQGAQAQK